MQGYSISNGYALSNKWLYSFCNRIYYIAQNITKKSEGNQRLPNYAIMYLKHSVPNGMKSQTWKITRKNPDPPTNQGAYLNVLLSI